MNRSFKFHQSTAPHLAERGRISMRAKASHPSNSSSASSPHLQLHHPALTSSIASLCARYLRSAGAAIAPQRIAPAVATDATAAAARSSELLLLRPPPAAGADDEAVLVVVEGAARSIRTLREEREEQRGRERERARASQGVRNAQQVVSSIFFVLDCQLFVFFICFF